MDGFDYVNVTKCSYLLLPMIEVLKLYILLLMLWFLWLVMDIIYHFWYYEFFGGWFYFLLDYFDGMFMIELFWVSTYPSEVLQLVYDWLPYSTFQWPFHPNLGLLFLTPLIILF